MTAEDRELIKATNDKKRIVILNKTDLEQKLDRDELKQLMPDDNETIIPLSVLKNDGLDKLEEEISRLFFNNGIENSQNTVIVTNARHLALLNKAEQSLDAVLKGIEAGMPVGDSYQDELLDQLFSQFCLGK